MRTLFGTFEAESDSSKILCCHVGKLQRTRPIVHYCAIVVANNE